MKHPHHKKIKRAKPLPPGLINSPLVTGLLNLIPVILVITLFGVNTNSFLVRDFKTVSLEQNGKSAGLTQLALKATADGDFTLAQNIYQQSQVNQGSLVLGARTEIERLIFPKETLVREINRLTTIASLVPSRTLYLNLSLLHWRNFDNQKAREYLDLAKSIDPNEQNLALVEKILSY